VSQTIRDDSETYFGGDSGQRALNRILRPGAFELVTEEGFCCRISFHSPLEVANLLAIEAALASFSLA
jgi:hypothetical protein